MPPFSDAPRRDAGVPPLESAPQFTLVRRAAVFAPEPLGELDILTCAGRIVAIAADIEPPRGVGQVAVIEAAGSRVIPGLVDGHVHILGGGGQGGPHTRNRDILLTEITSAGVTTVVGCLGMDYATRHLESLLAKARGIQTEGVTARITTGGYAVPTPTLTDSVISDLTLIEDVVGVGEVAISDHRSSVPTQAELSRLAAEAHVGALYGDKTGAIIFHVGEGKGGLQPLRQLLQETDVPVSQLLPTHINRTRALWEDAVAFARDGGTIDVTAGIAPARGFPAALKPADALAEALERGIPAERLTMSSDANGNMPFHDEHGRLVRVVVQSMHDLLEELRDLVCCNKVPLDIALQPVTSNVARTFGLRTKGRIQVGCDADLAVVTSDFEVRWLIARGRVLVADGAPAVRGFFE